MGRDRSSLAVPWHARAPRALVLIGLLALGFGASGQAAGARGAAGLPAIEAACPLLGAGGPTVSSPLAFGAAHDFGVLPPGSRRHAIVGMAVTPRGLGYWLVSSSGRVFGFGRARLHRSVAVGRADSIVGMAATRDGRGYWLASRAGRLFAVGDARLYGSRRAGSHGSPIIAVVATANGRGYWLIAADGSVLTRGDAHFYGSPRRQGGHHDIVSMAPTPDGHGYWLVASSGGILSYGDAHFHGSAITAGVHARFVGIAATRDGRGYWLAAADGRVLAFGDARVYAPPAPSHGPVPVEAIAADPAGHGYWLLPQPSGTGAALPPPGDGLLPCRVTAIGDSVMLDVAPALTADIPGIAVDAAVSRQWDAGIALVAQLKAEHTLGAIVVIDLGTNGPVTSVQFTDMMDALAGASRVVFVTVHLPPSYSWSTSINEILQEGVARYPQDRLADFNTLADANPQWFGTDGIHMPIGGPGAQAMAALIKSQI